MSSISHGTPPALSQNPVSTPAEEWADKTTSALATGSTSEPVASSGVAHNIETTSTSPGTELPGAYPQEAHSRSSGATSYTHSAGQVAHDAKGVAQGVADDVTHAIQSAGHTAAQYLPKGVVAAISPYLPGGGTLTASEHDHPHVKSLPSQELSGMQPGEKSEGVGALPGTAEETGVARLPDDRTPAPRTPSESVIPASVSDTAPRNGVAALPQTSTFEKLASRATTNLPSPSSTPLNAGSMTGAAGLAAATGGAAAAGGAIGASHFGKSDSAKAPSKFSPPTDEAIFGKNLPSPPQDASAIGTSGSHPFGSTGPGVSQKPGEAGYDAAIGDQSAAAGGTGLGATAPGNNGAGGIFDTGSQRFDKSPDVDAPSTTGPTSAESQQFGSAPSKDAAGAGVGTAVPNFGKSTASTHNDIPDLSKGTENSANDSQQGASGKYGGVHATQEPSGAGLGSGAGFAGAGFAGAGVGTGVGAASADKQKLRHEPPRVNLQPREWRTWQGVRVGIPPSASDVNLAEGEAAERDDDDDDDGTPHRQEVDHNRRRTSGQQRGQFADVADSQDSSKAKGRSSSTANTTDSGGSAGNHGHKAKFMDKVKGEVKIISGVLGNDHAKVEEGKLLKSGTR